MTNEGEFRLLRRVVAAHGAGAMAMWQKIRVDRRFHRLAGSLLVLGAGAVLVGWKLGVDGPMLKTAWKAVEVFLMDRPWLLFAALVVLPGALVPMSALLVLAGTVWRDQPGLACVACLVAAALNMTWTYWLAARPGRGLVERLLATTTIRIPELPLGHHLRMILILRLTPGLPFFLQNYALGFFRVPFRLYLPVSMACSGLITIGMVLSTAGVAKGNLMPLISGVALIALGAVVVQGVKAKILKR